MTADPLTLLKSGYDARREERPTDATRDFAEALSVARHNGMPVLEIRALKGLAQIERDEGRTKAALPWYDEAVPLCREHGDPLLLAHTVRHLADAHQDLGNLDLAEPLYLEAVSLYREAENPSDLNVANALRPLAQLYETRSKRSDALALWREARDLYAAVGIEAGVRECEDHMNELSE